MPQINVTDNVKGLREILCLAQYVGENSPVHINTPLYNRRIQEVIDELDKHRPVGPDGKHGNLHTETCGCKNKGHGPWCIHTVCSGCKYWCPISQKCKMCGHDWSIKELRVARCY
jgi:hypothetical protein